MANVDAPFGFKPIRHADGGKDILYTEYPLASGLASNIYQGDPVTLDGNGRVAAIGAASDAVLGIFMGVRYEPASGGDGAHIYPNWPTGTATKGAIPAQALIADAPNLIFKVQVDGAFAQADMGQLADITLGSANTAFKRSGAMINNVGSGQQVKILKIHGDSEVGANAVVECVWHSHALGGDTKSVAT